MKFIANSLELSDALITVSKAISGKSNIPILEGVKISACGDEVTLSATDLELFIETRIKANVKIEGETVVTGKLFTEFVKKLVEVEEIEIEKYSTSLVVRYNGNESEFQCMEDDTYPEIKTVSDENSFLVRERDLKEAIEGVIFCVSTEETRPILKGCQIAVKGEEMTCAALDGYRLGITKREIFNPTGDVSIVVLGKTLNEIVKVFDDREEKVKVAVEKNYVMFDMGHTKIITRLLEGDFIQYEKILPQSRNTEIVVNKNALEAGLDRATIVAKNKKNYLKMKFEGGKIEINSASEVGRIRETVDCKQEGKDIEIAFNSRYLFDAFNRIKEDFIKINLTSSNAPAVIIPVEGEKYVYLVLPLRMIG